MTQLVARAVLVVFLCGAGLALAREHTPEMCAKECESMLKGCQASCKEQIKKKGKGDPNVCGGACKDVTKTCTKMCSKEKKQ